MEPPGTPYQEIAAAEVVDQPENPHNGRGDFDHAEDAGRQ
jgi:hypothetical protein